MDLECSTCKKTKDCSFFSKKNNNKTRGYSYKCKECHNDYVRLKWYPENKNRQIESSKKWRCKNYNKYAAYRYSISVEDINSAFDKSDGKCQICGATGKLVIDHCHEENKFRGLLCGLCNLGLGHFKNSEALLRNAAKYIEKFKTI